MTSQRGGVTHGAHIKVGRRRCLPGRGERRGEIAVFPWMLRLLLLLLAASSAALLATSAHSSCPGPLAIPCSPRSCSRPLSLRSVGLRVRAPAPADGAGPTPRLGVPLPQREIGRREPERRRPSGLRGCTQTPHSPAERPRNAPGLQLSAEQRAASNPDSDARRPWSSPVQQVQVL